MPKERLIDANAIKNLEWITERGTADCGEEFVYLSAINEMPTVEAIPIEWIEEKKKTLRYQRIDLDSDDVDTAWDLKMKIEALEELIDEWNERKEE